MTTETTKPETHCEQHGILPSQNGFCPVCEAVKSLEAKIFVLEAFNDALIKRTEKRDEV